MVERLLSLHQNLSYWDAVSSTVVCVENDAIIHKEYCKYKLFCLLTTVNLLVPTAYNWLHFCTNT